MSKFSNVYSSRRRLYIITTLLSITALFFKYFPPATIKKDNALLDMIENAHQLPLPQVYIRKSDLPRLSRREELSYLVCATIMSCNEQSLDIFMLNTKSISDKCDYAIVCLRTENASDFMHIMRLRLKESGYRVVYLRRALPRGIYSLGNGTRYNDAIYPKSLLYSALLNVSSSYRRIWIFDHDVSFDGFNATMYYMAFECGFAHPLLVSQAPIREKSRSGRPFKYLNDKAHHGIAVETGFIEQQAAFFDSGFFRWFVENIVNALSLQSHILGSDWGFDCTFCRSAELYRALQVSANNVHSIPSILDSPACGLILAGSALTHTNTKSIDAILGREKKNILGRTMMDIVKRAYPDLYIFGGEPSTHPFAIFNITEVSPLLRQQWQRGRGRGRPPPVASAPASFLDNSNSGDGILLTAAISRSPPAPRMRQRISSHSMFPQCIRRFFNNYLLYN